MKRKDVANVVFCERSREAADAISEYLQSEGGRGSRSDAVRFALIREARRLAKENAQA